MTQKQTTLLSFAAATILIGTIKLLSMGIEELIHLIWG